MTDDHATRAALVTLLAAAEARVMARVRAELAEAATVEEALAILDAEDAERRAWRDRNAAALVLTFGTLSSGVM